jgi:cyclopropane fatty-acyl-phospholipid synthase-like methyltransferase
MTADAETIEPPLTVGNTAKLYCLKRIDRVASTGRPLLLLDLGCGDGRHLVSLLRRRPNITYLGVDLSTSACEQARHVLAGLGEVKCAAAYDLELGQAQVITSFSVFEHVYQRQRYLACLRANLAGNGAAFVNYDAGHFQPAATPLDWVTRRSKSPLRRMFASLGAEQFFQAHVAEAEFRSQVRDAGLRIVDEKYFNTDLKTVYRVVPETERDSFMERWLAFELYLNELGIEYDDRLARLFRTRNFVLTRADANRNHPEQT